VQTFKNKKCREIRKKMVWSAVIIFRDLWCLNYDIQKSDTFHLAVSLWSIITASWLPAKKFVLYNYYDLTFMMIINMPWDLGLYNLNRDSENWLAVLYIIQNFGKSQLLCLPPGFTLVSQLAYSLTLKQHVPPKRRLTFNGLSL
jgi:hypothetical protein